jgi:hypothetical protein
MKGKPFVLLGVNGDDDRATALKAMTDRSMTWPSLWNKSKFGGLVDAWGVRGWPTVYVLDASGVIRYDAVLGDELERAVEKLVTEAGETRK